MAFVYGHISLEDVAKYDMQMDYKMAIPVKFKIDMPSIFGVWSNLKFHEPLSDSFDSESLSPKWVIDREIDCYLRYGGMGHAQMGEPGQLNFMLYYQGRRMYVAIKQNTRSADEFQTAKIVEIILVKAVFSLGGEFFRDRMLDLLKDALVVFFNYRKWWFGNLDISILYHFDF